MVHANSKAADGPCSISRLFGFVVTNSEGVVQGFKSAILTSLSTLHQ